MLGLELSIEAMACFGGGAVSGISFVGSGVTTTIGTAGGTYNFSSLRNEADAAPSLAQNDIVLVAIVQAHGDVATPRMGTIAGYDPVFGATLYADDAADTSFQIFRKFMGAAPDSSIAIPAGSAAGASQAVTVHVLRGVNTVTPLDVAAVSATGINGGNPDPPAATPGTEGAWIYCAGGMSTDATAGVPAAMSNPAGMSATANHYRTTSELGAAFDSAIAASLKTDWAAGAFDCGAFSSGNVSVRQSWAAATLALRPA